MFNRLALIFLIGFVVSEPFLALTVVPKHHRVCRTCGMEDMCGDVCCCAGSQNLCGHHNAGLFAAGCTPDSARQFFFSQSAVKFLPTTLPLLFRRDLNQSLTTTFEFLPTPLSDHFSPPPEMDHLV